MGHLLCFSVYHTLVIIHQNTGIASKNVGCWGQGGSMTLTNCNTMYTTYYEGGTIYADDRNRNIQDDTGA